MNATRTTPTLDLAPGSFVGRERELAALVGGLEEALAGRGNVWLVSGEAGIGKSRLAEEAARHAHTRGVCVHWGRCWEAGGAPAYWPWLQILRALVADCAPAELCGLLGPRAGLLEQLLPELRQALPGLEPAPILEPEQARFQLLDAIAGFLFDSARDRPQLLVLEDLHVADASSLQLLEFVAAQARGHSICLVATFREAEADRAGAGAALSRVGREARSLFLTRLARDEVALYLEQVTGVGSDTATVDAIHATTEGNPLFLVETTRLLLARGFETLGRGGRQLVPRSVGHALRERLASLSRGARELLELAAVAGRDFSRERLAAISGADVADLAVSLVEALDAALVDETRPGQYRFSHILIREVLYMDLEAARREALHRAHADAIERSGGASTAWSELAHHLREAGPAQAERAVEAARRAALQAEAQHAVEEAVRLYALALDAHVRGGRHDETRRAELLLGEGRARMLAGDVEGGRARCEEVAAIARAAGDSALLARAALELGALFAYARVSLALVDLLGEALAAIEPGDSALRARLMARRAAARQPSLSPEEPIAEARAAIAMARRVGDGPALLDALRAGCSALMDVTDAAERVEFNAETVALAEQSCDSMAAFRGHVRLVIDCYELADLGAARAHVAACTRIAEELGHPHYRWHALALRAMEALREGRFSDAEELGRRVAELGAQAGESNAESCLLLQRVALLQLQGRFEEIEALIPSLERMWSGTRIGEALGRLYVAAMRARAGAAARAHLDLADVRDVLALGDRTQLDNLAEVCRLAGDPALAGRVLARLQPDEEGFVSGGVAGLTWDHPASRCLAILRWVMGDHAEAERLLAKALAQCEATGAHAHGAWVAWDLACLKVEQGRLDEAHPLLERAAEMARDLSMPGLLERARRALEAHAERAVSPPPAARTGAPGSGPPEIRLRRDGEVWLLEGGASELRLKDSRGVQLLARLLEEPGREIHVLDLLAPGVVVDAGDAGELLDRQARVEYERRARDVAEELERARAHHDLGRVESLRSELEAIADELSRGVALGGRERRAGSAAERARVNVQRRLRDAIRRIAACDPVLGRHLERCVRTGSYCSYEPH